MARQHKDIPSTKFSEVSVHITWTETDGSVTLRAYAIDTETGIRKDYSKERKRTAKSREEIPTKQEHLYKAVCDDIERHERKSVVKAAVTDNKTVSPMMRAFNTLETSTDPVSNEWSPGYAANNMNYFKRNLLSILMQKESTEWTAEDRDELQKTIMEKILSTKRSSGHEATALETAKKHLSAADQIYQRMRDYEPSLPELLLRPRFTGRHSKNEKIKSLPRPVRRKFVKLLENFIDVNPRLAMAAIIMYDCGLRTAESAAVWLDVIIRNDKVTCILVCYQVKEGKRTQLLKTKNAYRLVPMTVWGNEMINRCLAKLSDDPNDEANWICDTRVLSATIKKMLLEAGLTEDYFSAAEQAMRERPDFDEAGRPIYDVSAYILRRDWSSRARNICGFTSLEIDACLGHEIKISKRKRDDLRHLTHQARLATKLERYVHNPKFSKHPGVTPYSIEHSTELELIPFDLIRIRNTSDEPVSLKLDAEAVINGESITIIAPQGSQINSTQRLIRTNCSRSKEPVIGASNIKEDGTLEDV